MLARIRRVLSQFFNRSRTINNEPLNKVSLIVLILIDIFILINVFAGLDDISRWHISPTEAYPCYSEWQSYRKQNTPEKDYKIVKLALPYNVSSTQPSLKQYQQDAEGHLGDISNICLNYAKTKDKIENSENLQTIETIEQKEARISTLEQANRNIRTQYDSTLLEKIAGQAPQRSINRVGADKAKQQLDQNNRQVSTLKQETSNLKKELLAKPESLMFLAFLTIVSNLMKLNKSMIRLHYGIPVSNLLFNHYF